MHKYNKIRGILRAKQGSQIPKFWPGGQFFNTGSTFPEDLPSGMMNDGNMNYLDESTMTSSPPPFTWSSRNGELSRAAVNSMKDFKIPVSKITPLSKTTPSFWQKAKIEGKGLGKKAINFAGENQLLVLGGINMVSDKLFGGTENSSEFDTIDGALGTLQSVGGPVGWYATVAKVGLNAINKIGSREIEGHTMNTYLKSRAGTYGGLTALNSKVESDKTKEFGLFNNGGYKRALGRADKLFGQLGTFENIVNTADDQFAMAGNDLYLLGYEMLQNGGYPTKFLRASKQGGTLTQKIDLIKSRKFNQVINVNTKLVEEFKEGGVFSCPVDNSSINYPVCNLEWEPEIIIFKTGGIIESDYDIIYEIPKVEEFQKGGKTKLGFEEWFNMIPKQNRALGYDYKKAHEVLDWETLYNHTKNPDKYHLYSVSPVADENGNYPFLKLGKLEENPELQGEFDWYNSEEGAEHKSKFDIEYINDRYYYVPKKFKDGGKTKEELETPEIEETNQKNLIPEGALHKNKHHMEHTEGLTLKGIPVIDNEGEQLAEIELDEIIFTLEVTKKLEELYRDGSDEAAIEAGKLLVKEILFNTDDRTGLISKCEKGGKICQIEE